MLGFVPKRWFSKTIGQTLQVLRLKEGAHWLDVKDSHAYLTKKFASAENGDSSKLTAINEAFKIAEDYYKNNNLQVTERLSEAGQLNQADLKSSKDLYEKMFVLHFGTQDKSAIELPENAVKKVLFLGEYHRALRNLFGEQSQSFMDDAFWQSKEFTENKELHYKNNNNKNQKSNEEITKEFLNTAYYILVGILGVTVAKVGARQVLKEEKSFQSTNFNLEQDETVNPKNNLELRITEKQKLIDEAFESQNPMKSYPIGQKSSNSMDQIVDYTAYGDLKFYHLNASYFYKDIDEMTFTDPKLIEKKPLTGIRQNHMASIALEAERSLQSIFIKAEDLKRIIAEKGYYECPGVFMRYKGFIYFRHRAKPIVMKDIQHIPNNQTLSLFDIFHRYYSPLPEVYDEHYEFILQHGGYIEDTTTLENSSWIGNVTFNPRSIPKILIKGDEKNLFMWKGKNQDDPQESRYIKIWNTMHMYPAEPPIAYSNQKYQKN